MTPAALIGVLVVPIAFTAGMLLLAGGSHTGRLGSWGRSFGSLMIRDAVARGDTGDGGERSR